MSYDEYDALREEYEDKLYEEFYTQYRNSSQFYEDVDEEIAKNIDDVMKRAIEERLSSFYLEHPTIAQSSLALLSQARELYDLNHYSASQVFAGAATEVAFKNILLFPIVHGFVHSNTVAAMIVDIFAKRVREVDRFQQLLIHLVTEFSGIDVFTFKPSGSSRSLWEEALKVRDRRNAILHRAELVTNAEATQSISVASAVLETIFPAVMTRLYLHLHPDGYIYSGLRCKGQNCAVA